MKAIARNTFSKMFLIAVSLLLSLVGAELVLQALSNHFVKIRNLTYSPYKRVDFEKIIDWSTLQRSTDCSLAPGQVVYDFVANSHGFLTKDLPITGKQDDYRIVFLGDSFLVSGPRKFHFIDVTKKKLDLFFQGSRKTETINLGISCVGTSIYFKTLEVEGVTYNPDLVVVVFFVGNDFTDDDYNRDIINDWKDAKVDPIVATLYNFKLVALLNNIRNVIAYYKGPNLKPSENRSDNVFGQQLDDENFKYDPFSPTIGKDKYIQIELDRLDILYADSAAYKNLSLIKQNLINIRNLAAKQNAKTLVLIIPDEFQVNKSLRKEILAIKNLGEGELHLPQKIITTFLSENGIQYIDLLRYFESDDLAESYYQPYDTHFNSVGNERVAFILTEELKKFFTVSLD